MITMHARPRHNDATAVQHIHNWGIWSLKGFTDFCHYLKSLSALEQALPPLKGCPGPHRARLGDRVLCDMVHVKVNTQQGYVNGPQLHVHRLTGVCLCKKLYQCFAWSDCARQWLLTDVSVEKVSVWFS